MPAVSRSKERRLRPGQQVGAPSLRVALVAVADDGARELIAASFHQAKFKVHAVDDRAAALAAAKGINADIAVIDIGIAKGFWAEVQYELQHHVPPISIPVILTVSKTEQLSSDPDLALNVADYVLAPFDTEDLVHRAAMAIDRNERRNDRRTMTAQLREQTRQVSAAIRGTNDPEAMASFLVDGLGMAFRADRVLLRTFEDERVPQITTQWARPGLAPVPPSFGAEEAHARAMAVALWEESKVLELNLENMRHLEPGYRELPQWAAALGVRSAAVAPIGQGGSAFGMLWLIAVDGDRTWTPAELSLTQHVLGNLAHGLIQGQLITGQQQVVERLKELDQAKSEFVATVNHELRTPLTSIRGYLDMVQEGAGGDVPAGAAGMLKVVERNTVRLQSLMEDMLTLSRMDSGPSVPLKRVNVGNILTTVLTALSPLAASCDVGLRLDLAQAKLMVDGDADQLEQAFSNVTSNALKFSQPGSQVDVEATKTHSQSGPTVTIAVRDSGMGIPEEEIPQLFTRFFRASNATKAAVPGTGLGLAIVRGVMDQHDGVLTVDSVEGHGTTMTMELPAARRRKVPVRKPRKDS